MTYGNRERFVMGVMSLSPAHVENSNFFTWLLQRVQSQPVTPHARCLFANLRNYRLDHGPLTDATTVPDIGVNYATFSLGVADKYPVGVDLLARNAFVSADFVTDVEHDNEFTMSHVGKCFSGRQDITPAYESPDATVTSPSYVELLRSRVFSKPLFGRGEPYAGMLSHMAPCSTIVLASNHDLRGLFVGVLFFYGVPFLVWGTDRECLSRIQYPQQSAQTVNNEDKSDYVFHTYVHLLDVRDQFLILNPTYIYSKFSKWRGRFRDSGGTLTAIGCLREYLHRNIQCINTD